MLARLDALPREPQLRSTPTASRSQDIADFVRSMSAPAVVSAKQSNTFRAIVERARDQHEADGGAEAAQSGAAPSALFDRWIRDCWTKVQITEDLPEDEILWLISIARSQSRRNLGGHAESSLRQAADTLRQAMSLRVGDTVPQLDTRDVIDPIIPSIGNLQAHGLINESRRFVRARYKKSSDPAVETARRHWFRYTLSRALVSPIRPLPGNSLDALNVEEDLWINYAAFLGRSVQGTTVCQYVSNTKRWHRSVTGWDPISGSNFSMPMLAQALAGVRAELPSKQHNRFAHPSRLNALWRRSYQGVFDEFVPKDLSAMPTDERHALAHEIRCKLRLTGTSVDEFKHQVLSAAMFAALLRISEAIPIPSDEQEPILASDIVFKWSRDGSLRYAQLWVRPLKKKRGTPKVAVPLANSEKGFVKAARMLWLLLAITPRATDGPLFADDAGKVLPQKNFSSWYTEKIKSAGVVHWKHYTSHCLRIGGATACFAANIRKETVDAFGRWDGDCQRIYTRPTEERCLAASEAMDCADTQTFEARDDAFWDRLAGAEPSEDDVAALADIMQRDARIDDGIAEGFAGADHD